MQLFQQKEQGYKLNKKTSLKMKKIILNQINTNNSLLWFYIFRVKGSLDYKEVLFGLNSF